MSGQLNFVWLFFQRDDFSINITILGALSSTAWAACTLAVLGPYAGIASHHGPLNSERLFTIVTTVNLLSPPLTLLGWFDSISGSTFTLPN